ncbi:MAG: halocarboxylic acid dehydrogenase DehI family protein [Dehalococcoidia bacterium]
MSETKIPEDIAAALRSPFVPEVFARLGEAGRYLEVVWPQLRPSVETAGIVGSALYMVDMALDAVEAVYEPVLDRASLLAGGLGADEIGEVEAVLDVFHWVQPQELLICAALAEAWEQPRVGGQGRPDPRATSERELAHLETRVEFTAPGDGLLPEVAEALQIETAPELYRAVARWPRYLEPVWDELQHMAAYPDFRRRGRALYFYARSSSRFLAQPVEASRAALAATGLSEEELGRVSATLDAALPALATMMMHCCAMRVGLGITAREVVTTS